MSILFKFLFIFVGLFTPLFPVSAPPFSYEVEQPDGSKITIRMYGNEYYNWMETEDGYVIDWVEDNDRLGWYYSDLNSEGKFYPTNILVKYPAPDYLDIPKNLKEISPKVREFGHYNLHSTMDRSSRLERSALTSIIKPLVFLVDFNNLPSSIPDRIYNKEQFQHLLFGENLDSDDANLPAGYDMSVRDYYAEISNDNLEVFGDDVSIVDWSTADHDYNFYVDGAQGTGGGSNGIARSAAALVVEIALEHHSEIDFADFDGNNDGDVDLVILIVEGWGNGDDDQFWPHMSMIMSGGNGIETIDPFAPTNSDGYFSLDDVVIKKYIVITEQFHMNNYGVQAEYIHPIGTFCHEMGHILGLPDLYDTSENADSGIGVWGLMGAGNWQRQISPAYMSAWSRYHLGFTHPTIVENVSNLEISILPAEGLDVGAAYILPMSSNLPKEYLIIENRQKIGSDKYLKQSGLLVWHIDETIIDMYPVFNSVNVNSDFYGVNLLQADGDGDLYTHSGDADSGDPFPGSSGNTQITNSTNPNTDLYTYDRDANGIPDKGSISNISLINISENSDNSISLTAYNPNQQGVIIAYDEGGYEGIAYPDVYDNLQWAGIRVVASETSLLSGISTVFPPSYSPWNVTDYTINIWRGWSENKPTKLLYSLNGDVQWSPEDMRDGGWAHISFTDVNIIWNKGETYYVEINYNGSGGVYPLEVGNYSSSQADGMSYFRGNATNNCIPLTEISNGDWNIRVSLNLDLNNSQENKDCGGIAYGDGSIDNCLICTCGYNGNYSGTSNCLIQDDCIQDCAGIWGGALLGTGIDGLGNDVCGSCGGSITDNNQCTCDDGVNMDCAGLCPGQSGFGSVLDECNVCMGIENYVPETCEKDCAGIWGGSAVVDECGDCDGPGAIFDCGCQDLPNFACDCNGNILDECGVCGGENSCLSIFSQFIPDQFGLFQNYPNPFNSATRIRYDIPEVSKVSLRIYDISGREIAVLYSGYRNPGQYTITWDASNFVSGLYILEINVTSTSKSLIFRDIKKIIYIR